MARKSIDLLALFGVLLVSQYVVIRGAGNSWGYEGESGPDHWHEMKEGEGCAGTHQSPIDLPTKDAAYDPSLGDIDFTYDEQPDTVTTITNNGHTMVMTSTAEILVNGGGFEDTYRAAQAHLHWGSDDMHGSEHTVDGAAFPLEMHIVTYNMEKYATVVADEGLAPVLGSGDQSALAVFGIFFTLSSQNNTDLEPLLDHFTKIAEAGPASVEVPDFHMWDLLPPSLREYYRYQGSLTTPGCNEVVAWTLLHEKNTVSEYQLKQFRSLQDGDKHALQDNWRPVQPLNGRKITASFKTPEYAIEDGSKNTAGNDDEDPYGATGKAQGSIFVAFVGYIAWKLL